MPLLTPSSENTTPPGTMHEPVLFPVEVYGTLVAFNWLMKTQWVGTSEVTLRPTTVVYELLYETFFPGASYSRYNSVTLGVTKAVRLVLTADW